MERSERKSGHVISSTSLTVEGKKLLHSLSICWCLLPKHVNQIRERILHETGRAKQEGKCPCAPSATRATKVNRWTRSHANVRPHLDLHLLRLLKRFIGPNTHSLPSSSVSDWTAHFMVCVLRRRQKPICCSGESASSARRGQPRFNSSGGGGLPPASYDNKL